jgi:hypothetical protein
MYARRSNLVVDLTTGTSHHAWRGIGERRFQVCADVVYPLLCRVVRSESADAVAEDVDWWIRCLGDAELLGLDPSRPPAFMSRAT